jgi:type IV secretion system protein VirB2
MESTFSPSSLRELDLQCSGVLRLFKSRNAPRRLVSLLFFAPAIVAGFILPAQAQVVTQDPAGSSPLVAALEWVQGTLLGNVATAAAVIAVAVVGFMMLTGRIEWRRGLTVVIGCFIIFGAVAIVSGIRSLAGGLH